MPRPPWIGKVAACRVWFKTGTGVVIFHREDGPAYEDRSNKEYWLWDKGSRSSWKTKSRHSIIGYYARKIS